MNPPQNDTLLRALRREPTDYTPIWLMRQAGRYLPEYNATRARAGSFMALCTDPELAADLRARTLQRNRSTRRFCFRTFSLFPTRWVSDCISSTRRPAFRAALVDEEAVAKLATDRAPALRV
jgi:uroporphyrinogen decarboxylase